MAGRFVRFLRGVLSPRLGVDGSAATSALPPGRRPVGIETNAGWAGSDEPPVRDHDERDDRRRS